jgi:hypothetical protein
MNNHPQTDSMKEGCKFNFSELKKEMRLKGLGDLFSGFYHRQEGWVVKGFACKI